ncbi:hypothetical protein [Membranihabitans maritimus]|uniref:hypothetical protein n=1 Tax=Membranihabitans maritimus TaxID=2904244 RepID=UPI001F45A899|nr:hypothetical protein [Membranihabitans maritimus]
MKKLIFLTLLCVSIVMLDKGNCQSQSSYQMEAVTEFSLGEAVGQVRAVPVNIDKEKSGLLLVYSKDKEIDPWNEMFYAPTDNLKFAMYNHNGELLWRKELEYGTINGVWFTPVYPFDLDSDGTEEIYFVKNTDSVHILSYDKLRLVALDSRNGETIGQWPWKKTVYGSNSAMFRNFIIGGYVEEEPVLITAQGTYGKMGLQAWNKGMKMRWDLLIPDDNKGARGSHMSPVLDINRDNVDEILWGERCISIDSGKYLFIADKDRYNGHSDVIQPTLDRSTQDWYLFTCRESGEDGSIQPRVVMFDDQGNRVWTDLEVGHMDMGWTAHVNSGEANVLAYTISRGDKVAGPDGFIRFDVKEYIYHALTGDKMELSFNVYNTIPVDINGDGYHEFISGLGEQADRNLYTVGGEAISYLGERAYVAMASKFMDLPGEQILCYYPNGDVKIWADKKAFDTPVARKRYRNPYYHSCQKLTAVGYNLSNLGGL